MGASIISAGVDWYRATFTPGPDQDSARRLYLTQAAGLFALGHTAKPWCFQGYRGELIGSIAYGTRADGACCNVSGSLAHPALLAMKRLIQSATRIDLQISFRFTVDRPGFAGETLAAVNTWQRNNARRSHPHPYMWDGNGHGDTFYLGSRESASFCRLYDKSREQRHKENLGLWRMEVQFNRDLAPLVLERLRASCNEAEEAKKLVAGWCSSRGIELPLDLGSPVILPVPVMPETDMQRKLMWLRKYVRGTVLDLYAAGYADEVHEALFMTDHHGDEEELDNGRM